MELKSLLVDSKTTWVEFPGLDNFEVELYAVSQLAQTTMRSELGKMTLDKTFRATKFIWGFFYPNSGFFIIWELGGSR